jgi:hypothetical protein
MQQELYDLINDNLRPPYPEDKVIDILTKGVMFLAKVKDMPGKQKKELLLKLLREAIDNRKMSYNRHLVLSGMLNLLGNPMVDNIIVVAKSKLFKSSDGCCLGL